MFRGVLGWMGARAAWTSPATVRFPVSGSQLPGFQGDGRLKGLTPLLVLMFQP